MKVDRKPVAEWKNPHRPMTLREFLSIYLPLVAVAVALVVMHYIPWRVLSEWASAALR